jgi:hypothetical protein
MPHLPPSIQRFGRCGGEEEDDDEEEQQEEEVEDTRQDAGPRPSSSSPPPLPLYHHGPSSANTTTAPLPQQSDRVQSFMNGVMSPFTACFQPTITSCVSGGATCSAPDFATAYRKTPAVVVTPSATKSSSKTTATRRGLFHHHPHQRDSRLSPTSVGGDEQESYHRLAAFASRPGSLDVNATAESASSSSVVAVTSSSSVMPTDNITQPQANDILCGRGGSSNRHSGNIHFRELVAANKKTYVTLTKKQKMMLARQIVDLITSSGGRFLARETDSSYFYDIGLPRSLEKTSQALREKNSNELPLEQEGEGIETSVESFQSVVKKEEKGMIEISESVQIAGESPESDSTKTTKPFTSNKSPKNVEPPSLVIPPHLLHLYDPDRKPHEADSTLSPNGPRPTAKYHHGSPYLSPYGNQGGPPTPPDAYHGVPVLHHRHPAYTSPLATYAEHGYYYHHHPHEYPPHTPPYGQYPYPEDHGRHHHHHHFYTCPPMDKREAYSEYYSKSTKRESPCGADVHGHPHRSPIHYAAHPYPPTPRQPYHRGRPGAAPPPLPPSYDRTAVTRHGAPVSPPSYRPSPYAGHPSPYRHPGVPLPALPPPVPSVFPADGSAPQMIYRTPSNGYVRGNVDVSPERQREVKRQRNVDGHIRRVSEVSLSSAVRNSLTLEDRIVGKERPTPVLVSSSSSSAKSSITTSTSSDLLSPSSILQSRSRRSMDSKDQRTMSLCQTEEDYSRLSGLAALSTAAFLKMDEDI